MHSTCHSVEQSAICLARQYSLIEQVIHAAATEGSSFQAMINIIIRLRYVVSATLAPSTM